MIIGIHLLDDKIELVGEMRAKAISLSKSVLSKQSGKGLDAWESPLKVGCIDGHYTTKHLVLGNRVISIWRRQVKLKKGTLSDWFNDDANNYVRKLGAEFRIESPKLKSDPLEGNGATQADLMKVIPTSLASTRNVQEELSAITGANKN